MQLTCQPEATLNDPKADDTPESVRRSMSECGGLAVVLVALGTALSGVVLSVGLAGWLLFR